MKKLLFITHFFIFNFFLCFAKQEFGKTLIENAKKSVVTIKVKVSLSAELNSVDAWEGTGFVISKKKGIILTNAHVSGRSIIGKYDIIFQDGTQIDAKLLYYDPWLDYAFLKTNPSEIPNTAVEIKFSKKNPKINESVLIIGNNEGKSFSVHTGSISGLNEVLGIMPQHSIRLTLNTKGGSSGSPILNTSGEAISLNYAGDNIFAFGLHPEYIRYAFKYIEKGHIPIRKHVGIICDLYPLSQAVKHRKLNKNRLNTYMKKFPKSRSNAIIVKEVLRGSPVDGKLKNGDIIWAIDKNMIGPCLYKFDQAMNNTKTNKIKITVLRNNKFLDMELRVYDLEKNKIKKIISFNKGVIFEMDDQWSYISGVPAKTLTGKHKLLNGHIKILSANAIDVNNLNDVLRVIPSLIESKYFFYDVDYLSPYPLNYSGWYTYAKPRLRLDMFYDSLDDPKIFTFDDKTLEWKSNIIK